MNKVPSACVQVWLVAVIAVVLRFAHFDPVEQHDSGRFLDQAKSIVAGLGPSVQGNPLTELAPGYPAFVAMLQTLYLDTFGLAVANLIISLVACYLVYHAIRPWDDCGAKVALLVMGVHPLLICWPRSLMSETLGVFLSALAVYLITALGRKPRLSDAFGYGLVSIAIPLTVPAVAFVTALVYPSMLFQVRHRKGCVAAMIAGALVAVLPWQVYCYVSSGRVAPLLLHRYEHNRLPAYRWIRTWAYCSDDMRVLFRRELMHGPLLPLAAFDSECDRDFARRSWNGNAQELDEELNAMLEATAQRRRRCGWCRFYVVPALVRALALWFDPGMSFSRDSSYDVRGHVSDLHYISKRQLAFLSPLRLRDDLSVLGWKRTTARVMVGVVAWVDMSLYVSAGILFFLLCYRALNARAVLPLCVIAGVAAYTGVIAITALTEVRRNQPFYPWLLYLFVFQSAPSTLIRDKVLRLRKTYLGSQDG